MTFDDETLMAFGDGELDPIAAKRVERAIKMDPTLADRVAAHRLLRRKVNAAFPLNYRPDPLSDVIRAQTVVAMPVRSFAMLGRLKIAAVAACVVAVVAVGTQWKNDRLGRSNGAQLASRSLAAALQTQLASDAGDTHMLVSFRNRTGEYCRVFSGEPLRGIACKNAGSWELTRTYSGSAQPRNVYRQAASANSDLMQEAQNMMVGDPLSKEAEQTARAAKWNAK